MTTYALIQAGQIVSIGGLPAAARRISDGTWLIPHDRQWTDQQAAACGYLPVVEVARPADTATDTSDLTHALTAGVPTQVWTVRAWTAGELAERLRDTNKTTIADRADAAITANTAFLALASPTNAQALAQTKVLTRAVTALIRIVLALVIGRVDKLDSTAGTSGS